jgi:hypothetical protein
MAIESADYEQARVRLMADRTVQAMARGCRSTDYASMAHGTGSPVFSFMQASNREYQKRTGHSAGAHIGAVAEAILRLLALREQDWPEPGQEQMTLDGAPEAAPAADRYSATATVTLGGVAKLDRRHLTGTMDEVAGWLARLATSPALKVQAVTIGRVLAEDTEASLRDRMIP